MFWDNFTIPYLTILSQIFIFVNTAKLCYNQLMNQHFLQSTAWEKFQNLEGHQTFRISNDNYSALVILQTTPIGNYLFCPYGPTLATANADNLKSALSGLTQLTRKHQAFFIRIEPPYSSLSINDLKSLGLKKSHNLNPAHTWVLDLTIPREELLKNMRKSNVQYWQSSAKKGLTIRTSQDPTEVKILSNLLRGVADKDHFTPQDEAHLQRQIEAGFAILYFAEYQGQTLAASLVYDFGGTRIYAHAATSDQERKLAAGTVLLVQMILDAQENGAKTFDFWGITTSEDKNHPWYGFSQYKRSFGGHEVDYTGTWDLPLKPTKYHLYQIMRRFNRLKRKILR